MNRKFLVFALAALFLAFSCVPQAVLAKGYEKRGEYRKGLDGKVFYKAKSMLKNQDELGLSDKQVKQIKDLKYAAKKELVRRNAEIKLTSIEIKEKLYEDRIDVHGINKLIDKKYKLKNAKAKYLVQVYAELKNVPTKEQMKKFKKLLRKACK
ncbi:MAG: hypothetical protein PVH45_00450 [Candidatus Omnitrophota bacterium]|jgi:Spy/CpxP family protein refolding chaperone